MFANGAPGASLAVRGGELGGAPTGRRVAFGIVVEAVRLEVSVEDGGGLSDELVDLHGPPDAC